ncbi:MAG: SDR family oxidoreductase [Bacteroidales bacterium]|nr:SDR family oxidoreductase [Bacteroidales bacterium]
MKTLSNKNIVITGASSGIGREIAIEASHLGASVILIARKKEGLQATYERLKAGDHIVFSSDITNYMELEPLITKAVQKTGKISGFVHAAGIEMTMPFRNMKPDYYEKIFGINVIAGLELARIISKKNYLDESGGSFVFISSVMGKFGKEGKVAYCASKAALTSSIKAMALELSQKKIRCNAILPGVVKTSMVENMFASLPDSSVEEIIKQHPLGLGLPEDIAHIAVFLLSDKAKWITGSEIVIDGGYSAG